jgi:tetratricopeptide (TPR) repeat protein
MRRECRYAMASFAVTLFLALETALVPAAAQQVDLNAIQRRFHQFYESGNYPAALQEAQKLEIGVKARFGVNHASYGDALNNLARVYASQAKYSEAQEHYKRALTVIEKTRGAGHPDVATILANLANAYMAQGKYAVSEVFYKHALEIHENALGAASPVLARTLNNLANVYAAQGKYADAQALLTRALTIRERALGAGHPDVALIFNNLGETYRDQRKYAEAEGLYSRAVAIYEHAVGADSPDLARSLDNLASTYVAQGRYPEAEELYKRALVIDEKAFGPDHANVGEILHDLSGVYEAKGQPAEADGLSKRALGIREKALGQDHPEVAKTLDSLAIRFAGRGDSENALAYSRKATAAVIAHATTETTGAQYKEGAGGLVEQRALYFVRHVANIATALQKRLEPEGELGREAFVMAQWAKQSAAAAAVQQMGLRFAAGTDALAALVRERQDLSAFRQSREKLLIAALAKPQGEQNPTSFAAWRKELAETESKLAANTARLEREFPAYADLANPKPLQVDDVQQLLGADEAMVFFLRRRGELRLRSEPRELRMEHPRDRRRQACREGSGVPRRARSREAAKVW